MTDRDRLIELIVYADTDDSYECKLCTKDDVSCRECGASKLADHLLANGVIVPPCKVGDTVWLVYPLNGTIESREVKSIDLEDLSYFLEFTNGHCYSDWKGEYDKYLFLTKEEAEAKLKEMKRNG